MVAVASQVDVVVGEELGGVRIGVRAAFLEVCGRGAGEVRGRDRGIVPGRVGHGDVEILVLFEHVFGYERTRDFQPFDGRDLDLELTASEPRLVALRTALHHLAVGVDALFSRGGTAVAPLGGECRRHVAHRTRRAVIGIHRLGFAHVQVERHVEPFGQPDVVVGPHGEAFPRKVLPEKTVHIVVAQADFRARGLAGGGDAQGVRLAQGVLFEDHAEPVGVRIEIGILRVEFPVVGDLLLRVDAVQTARRRVVVHLFVLGLHVAHGVFVFGHAGRIVERDRIGVVHRGRFAALGAFGGDEDHAGGGAGSVDGGRGGVFQHGDILHIGRIDIADRSGGAVDDDQRRAVFHRGDAADADGGVGAGGRIGPRHGDSGQSPLKGVRNLAGFAGGECRAVNAGDGARKILFAHRAVADHHHVVHLVDGFAQNYLHLRFAGGGDCLGFVTDK